MNAPAELLEKLMAMGLAEKEARVYLSLVLIGEQPVSSLARQTELKRTTLYTVVEDLMKKGLVNKTAHHGVSIFSALDPQRLDMYLEHEAKSEAARLARAKASLGQLVTELVSLQPNMAAQPKVRFFEGERGMREAYEDTLNASETILAMANIATMHEGLPYFFPDYYKQRSQERKIHIQAIFPDNAASRERAQHDKEENRSTRFIPEKDFPFVPEINIYDNKVLVISWQEKIALLIESEAVAQLHKQLFKLAWAGALQYK